MSTDLPAAPRLDDPAHVLAARSQQAQRGGSPKYHEKNTQEGKLFCRERLRLLFDAEAEFVEDGLLATPAICRPTVWLRASVASTVVPSR
jgi:acetyl-CoA carboxylase carboxyltransferase component